jgi:hypothetical protein
MVAGVAAAKTDLMKWVQGVAPEAVQEMFKADAVAIVAEKGKQR